MNILSVKSKFYSIISTQEKRANSLQLTISLESIFFFQPNSSVKIKYATYITLRNSSVSFDTPKFGRKVGFSKIEGHILLKTNYPLSKAIPQTLPVLKQTYYKILLSTTDNKD